MSKKRLNPVQFYGTKEGPVHLEGKIQSSKDDKGPKETDDRVRKPMTLAEAKAKAAEMREKRDTQMDAALAAAEEAKRQRLEKLKSDSKAQKDD